MEGWYYLLLLNFLLYINVSFAGLIPSISEQTDETVDEVVNYLNKYGYNPCKNSTIMACTTDFASQIMKFQRNNGLEETGKMDAVTLQFIRKPRCGNPDSIHDPENDSLLKWSKDSLTWSLRGHPEQLSFVETEAIMQWAFLQWVDHIQLNITQTCSKCKADLIIDFLRKDHGDGFPFDGLRGTLGHAFFPSDGRIHFDKDEKWNNGFEASNSLYIAAVHEIGHALGMEHHTSRESIMYPISQTMPSNTILPIIDRNIIQNAYGHRFPSILKKDQSLEMNQELSAPNGKYSLVMKSDGNLVLYEPHSANVNRSIWESGTAGQGIPPYQAILQQDGNLVIYDGNKTQIWATGTVHNSADSFLVVQNDGNLILYENLTSRHAIWAAETKLISEGTSTTSATTPTIDKDALNCDDIKRNFKNAYPDDTILIYKQKNNSTASFDGDMLLNVYLNNGYRLKIYKLTKTAANIMTSAQIKRKAHNSILETNKEVNMNKRRYIIYEKLKELFPSHNLNIFIFDNNNWNRCSYNTKGVAYFDQTYGSEVDIVLS